MSQIPKLLDRLSQRWRRLRHAPHLQIVPHPHLTRLGTEYGGWVFEPSANLYSATILSCGLGEDASFDVAFASRFNARVIVVDPTPRAIAHFHEMLGRVGQPATRRYIKGGRQPVEAYDLAGLSAQSMVLEPSAVWTTNTRLKFFAPPDAEHVSHSVMELPEEHPRIRAHIEVDSTTVESLLKKHRIKDLPLIKLDIEGAAGPVIGHMLASAIYPHQILVEFDELNTPSALSKHAVEDTHRQLRRAGYTCRYFDGRANLLYIRGDQHLCRTAGPPP